MNAKGDDRGALDLCALIGARICHDLSSPVGAIANGIELLAMTGGADGPEARLISDSAAGASARLRFLRIAFGGASGAPVSGHEAGDILQVLHGGGRMVIDWQVTDAVPRAELRLAFLLLLCVEAPLALGGHLRVTRGGTGWHLAAEGERLRADPAHWAHLYGEQDLPGALTANDVQFALAPLAARALARPLQVSLAPSAIDLRF
ncbi:histidine phosphotransferase family protein [Anianabacter salinae]|uniref:histidine phosphotransferase family protein n=1 Tax=Anianabacter salinae TaxID=2851023 RepID=UPI00225E65E4|nr:histidine phosphotransferase family protein [Anianabacter salinae]MBV0911955.1 histidine phosphotransferase [Anianabacter salinae]